MAVNAFYIQACKYLPYKKLETQASLSPSPPMYTKPCKCCCWAASNKVSLLLISSSCCFCFFSHSAVCCESMPGVPLQSNTKPAAPPAVLFAFSFWSTSSGAFLLSPWQHSPLQGHSSPPPGVTAAPGELGHHCSQALSEEDATAAWCPVSSPESFLSASLGNHMDKALVTDSWRTKCSHFIHRFSDLRAKFG